MGLAIRKFDSLEDGQRSETVGDRFSVNQCGGEYLLSGVNDCGEKSQVWWRCCVCRIGRWWPVHYPQHQTLIRRLAAAWPAFVLYTFTSLICMETRDYLRLIKTGYCKTADQQGARRVDNEHVLLKRGRLCTFAASMKNDMTICVSDSGYICWMNKERHFATRNTKKWNFHTRKKGIRISNKVTFPGWSITTIFYKDVYYLGWARMFLNFSL